MNHSAAEAATVSPSITSSGRGSLVLTLHNLVLSFTFRRAGVLFCSNLGAIVCDVIQSAGLLALTLLFLLKLGDTLKVYNFPKVTPSWELLFVLSLLCFLKKLIHPCSVRCIHCCHPSFLIDHNDGGNYAKLFVGAIPRTVTEEQVNVSEQTQSHFSPCNFLRTISG